LTKLGKPRATIELKKQYLYDHADEYKNAATNALQHPGRLPGPSMRLRGLVRHENMKFTEQMRTSGHAYQFEEFDTENDAVMESLTAFATPREEHSSASTREKSPRSSKRAGSQSRGKSTSIRSSDEFLEQIQKQVRIHTSTELPGMVNPDVVPALYQTQTSKWQQIATDHILTVAEVLRTAAESLLELVCPNHGATKILHEGLLKYLDEAHRRSKDEALACLQKYCNSDKSNTLQTTNPLFTEKFRVIQMMRLLENMRWSFDEHSKWLENAGEGRKTSGVDIANLIFEHCHHSAEQNTVYEVHDALKVYYDVSSGRFFLYGKFWILTKPRRSRWNPSSDTSRVLSPRIIFLVRTAP
jgi:hypothetical protein